MAAERLSDTQCVCTEDLAATSLRPSLSAFSLRWLCYGIKFFMGLHRVTWVRSSVCPIYRIGVISALPTAQITWTCHHSNFHYWQYNINSRTAEVQSCTPRRFSISVPRRNFPLRFGIFLEPSKTDGMTLRFPK